MKRRDLLKAACALPTLALWRPAGAKATLASRVRPGMPGWPAAALWEQLGRQVGGRLQKLAAPFSACLPKPGARACVDALAQLQNTFAIGDQPALTQTSGWAGAWTSQASAYAVAARDTADVVAAVNFARTHRLRLVVKGGGHSYQGTSDAPDSLLIWTRKMKQITLHEDFVAQGCAAQAAPQHAVSIGAGAMWIDAYHAVTTEGGRYVQGGGCTTVGVAGLVQSGGFSNFSKRYGTAAAGLLEAEVVCADGQVRIANACTNAELFWGLKGGGGGSLGVVTRVTLRTRELPATLGGLFFTVKAGSDAAYRRLIGQFLAFYRDALMNPHWGEQIAFTQDRQVKVQMVYQGLSQADTVALWAPLLEQLRADPDYVFEKAFASLAIPARHFWDAAFFKKYAPGLLEADPRAGAPAHHARWKGDGEQAGWFIHGYQSAWLPATLLQADQEAALADALFAATRHWDVGLHFNKGLAGAPQEEIEAARDSATNPDALGAFALAIIAGGGKPAYPGQPGADPALAEAARAARQIGHAMTALRQVAPEAGSYVSESDYFEADWGRSFWGSNYPRLKKVKRRYDPEGLFFVHHGVGSDEWDAAGFKRLRPAARGGA